MPNLKTVLDGLTEAGGGFVTEASESWGQGRTLYGGITAALCAQAALRAVPDLPPLRSAQVAFLGPAAGRLRFEPRVLRKGRSATFLGVDATGEAGPAARATLVYGSNRDSEIVHDLTRVPDLPPPEAAPPLLGDDAPVFFQNFEIRHAAGATPVSQAHEPRFDVWVRHRDAAGVDPVIALLAAADCPPPAAMTSFARRAPISTMTWAIDLMQPIGACEWYLARSTSEQAGDGYSLQAMELWGDGRRLAVGRQVVALFI